ncbi:MULTISPECIES: YbaB/EbfC family nucleoid-associated protein [unclassified Fusibacter]|uniref:YbaB/EbfC family nucleoid-associated protein n=1 Tax=unclassified Fusibacter TaxID=2624464 RepID=UPI001010FD60|nr:MULTISPECIES: YbaB/EbfC family nucleoid-associated protein [unclassified Fusibacter]MCK8060865.1 YbaB/EbfC family nucleoid-associated protein [Fusibacter sp. A2]NPE23161.1 YbaB/EbfC family nucleoid-associated protein [Fusibacter sp. A1]RXV59519.1 YbaB/EbfC family nucleoid-associated protein [Fusibacter sp. A1]
MSKGKFKGAPGGMGNMGGMMKQVQKMQRDMEKAQKELEETIYESTAGGGAVKIVLNGKKEIQSLELSEAVVDPDDIEMLQDLIIVALNDAMKQVDEQSEKVMGKMTGGMNIPGLF